MLAPFATLAFLATLWLIAAIGTEMFSRSGRRIVAALRGETPAAAPRVIIRCRTSRAAYSRTRPLRAQPQLRAAA